MAFMWAILLCNNEANIKTVDTKTAPHEAYLGYFIHATELLTRTSRTETILSFALIVVEDQIENQPLLTI